MTFVGCQCLHCPPAFPCYPSLFATILTFWCNMCRRKVTSRSEWHYFRKQSICHLAQSHIMCTHILEVVLWMISRFNWTYIDILSFGSEARTKYFRYSSSEFVAEKWVQASDAHVAGGGTFYCALLYRWGNAHSLSQFLKLIIERSWCRNFEGSGKCLTMCFFKV